MLHSGDIIRGYVSSEHHVLIGSRTAAEMSRALLRHRPQEPTDLLCEVRGRDLQTGDPRTIVISRLELRDAIRRS